MQHHVGGSAHSDSTSKSGILDVHHVEDFFIPNTL
jgi:hypothetical protein